ncbi:MAG: DUF4342 domain-containing protein [Peptococcaceae bacterium]|nr:DUF4342 domain-containing protein [Peptococcaceae bacterium]
MTTIEQVEKLCAMANISYEESKAALDSANGDLLDAIIFLEKQGKVRAPTGDGYYSSEKNIDKGTVLSKENGSEGQEYKGSKEKSFCCSFKRIREFCLKMIRKGNANSFEVIKGEEIKASLPVTILVFLLLLAFWATVPLIIIGLFFGFKYRFIGPDFKGSTINDTMNDVAAAAENLKKSMKS